MKNTVAHHIAQYLKDEGVQFVFGLPGGASLPLIEGLRQAGIQFVLVRNESSAVYMAEVTARLTGTIGACLVTLGPGATNAYAGVANAWLDRSPVLIFTADFPEAMKQGHTHQVLDLEAIFKPVTKKTLLIEPNDVLNQLHRAVLVTKHGRPGPVHIRLTGQVADLEVEPEPLTQIVQRPAPLPDVTPAHQALAVAKKPIIVAGLGLEPERPYGELRQLAESLQAPVIDLPKSRGCFPTSHPLFAGTIGLTQTDPAYELLDEADCVIGVGFDPVELVKPWQHSAPFIWVSSWLNEDPKLPSVLDLVGPISESLKVLSEADCLPAEGWGEARVGQLRTKLASRTYPEPENGRILPQQALTAVRRQLPPNTLISTDVGSHKILTALQWQTETPNRYMVSNGLSAMGFGLPAAIAANLILDEPTVCIHGDGGFQMVLGELGLLTESGRCVISIVLNDAALDLIRAKQLRRDEAPFGTEFVNPNFADIAKGYEIDHYLVTQVGECETAVQHALENNHPAIIEVMIDPISYPTAAGQAGSP
ncbi:MAG: thiamine pyrophosphate-binding protein [Chloroflexota bacterium]